MRLLLTGANGWVGSAVARELIAAGHTVVGLVRSSEKGAGLIAAGGEPLIGSLTDLDLLRDAAADAHAVIHTAFTADFARIAEASREDRAAIEAFGEALAGTDRPLVVTGGLGLSAPGETLAEDARPPVRPEFPRASEQTAFALAGRGVRAMVVRLARSTHGVGETHDFVPMVAAHARRTGVSAWIGDGVAEWSAVHRDDAARLYRLAVERGGPGEAYHAVAENVPVRRIADAIGRQVGVPARALSREEGERHFGPLATWVAGSGAGASDRTRAALGWTPHGPALIEDIERLDYSG